MVSNIDKMIESVLEREDLMKELAERETYDDVYDFCSDIQGGYSRDELFEFLESNQDEYGQDEYDMDIARLDQELSYVSGGKDIKSVGGRALLAMKFYKDMKVGPTIFKPHGNEELC
ncbi:MAG: hypothetical protein IJJ04_03135 [Clostridia bacterium]|nr:hypothetical protein [Clostridia bacterium]